MNNIDKQYMSLNLCATSSFPDLHFKKDLVSNPAWWEVWINILVFEGGAPGMNAR